MKRIFEKILNQEINDSQRIYENRQLLTEALTQKQKREVLDYIKEHSFVPLIGGNYYYFIVPADDIYLNMPPKLEDQLKRNAVYGTYISGIISKEAARLPIDSSWLPIYGFQDNFVTKWFANDYETAFARDLRDRQMKLSKRLDLDKIK